MTQTVPQPPNQDGRLAQRESTRFTREGSLVQSQYRPPSFSNVCLQKLEKGDGSRAVGLEQNLLRLRASNDLNLDSGCRAITAIALAAT